MHIIAIDDYPNALRSSASFPCLKDHRVTVFHDTEKDPVKLAQRLHDADVVLLTQQRSAFPRAVIERLPALKLISQTGRHTAHIDLAACTEHGIVVSAAGSGSPHATAELTWGLILSSVRNIAQEVAALKAGSWQTTIGTGLHGKTLGIYAFGGIGRLVAGIGRAFGMQVICWGREGSLARAREEGFAVAASRETFFESSDVISLHIPLNKDTSGIVTVTDLGRMKSSALIVNTSRAPLIEAGALIAALKLGRPGWAATDVYEDEPVVGGGHPLLSMPNVVCTPHLGYVERHALDKFYAGAIDSILGFAAGAPVNVLNPEAIGKRS